MHQLCYCRWNWCLHRFYQRWSAIREYSGWPSCSRAADWYSCRQLWKDDNDKGFPMLQLPQFSPIRHSKIPAPEQNTCSWGRKQQKKRTVTLFFGNCSHLERGREQNRMSVKFFWRKSPEQDWSREIVDRTEAALVCIHCHCKCYW